MLGSLGDLAPMLRYEKVQPFVHTEGALREVHEGITDLMKQLANEPSVGLFFVQQHVHKAVPVMVSLKAQMVDSTTDAEYVTQDVRDALNSVKSMKDVGPAVIERMIRTIDSSLPRVASLRPLKRDGLPQGSLTRSGDFKETLAMQPSQMQSNSPGIPNIWLAESSADAAHSSSCSVVNQGQSATQLREDLSDQGAVGIENIRCITSEGESAGYVRTMVDTAFQRASMVANVTKWNSNTKVTKVGILSTGDVDFLPNIAPQTDTDPRFSVRNVLGTAFNRASNFGKTMTGLPTGACGSEENPFLARDMQEGQDVSAHMHGKTTSPGSWKEVPGYRNPGYYMRSALESAMQTAGNVSREGSKFLYGDEPRPFVSEEKPAEGWNWLQVPSKALRSLNKKSENYPIKEDLIVTNPMGDRVTREQDSSAHELREDGRRLLDMELESYEAFAAERVAKLEEWLGDTEGDDKEIK